MVVDYDWLLAPVACCEVIDGRNGAVCPRNYYCYMCNLAFGLKNLKRYFWTLCLLDELFDYS